MRIVLFTLLFFSITSSAFSQSLSEDTLHWADYKLLTWNDFKGETIENIGLGGQTFMVILADFQKASIILPAKAKAVAVFDRKNSWTNSTAMNENALRYHQITFNLYEVYTRKLRREFKNTKFGLNPNKVFQEKYNSTLTELMDRNKQLMKETKMGQDSVEVKKWDIIITRELNELDEYKEKK